MHWDIISSVNIHSKGKKNHQFTKRVKYIVSFVSDLLQERLHLGYVGFENVHVGIVLGVEIVNFGVDLCVLFLDLAVDFSNLVVELTFDLAHPLFELFLDGFGGALPDVVFLRVGFILERLGSEPPEMHRLGVDGFSPPLWQHAHLLHQQLRLQPLGLADLLLHDLALRVTHQSDEGVHDQD